MNRPSPTALRRGALLLAALLGTQLLAGCVIVPRPYPYYRPRAVIVEPQPGYDHDGGGDRWHHRHDDWDRGR